MTVESVRVTFRAHVREQVLSVARDLTVERGWERVRVAEIASVVGVSRPTIYKEFGDKRGLGDALVLAEAERFLDGIRSVLGVHGGDPGAAIAASVRYTLDEATASPLLKAVLTSHRRPSGSDAATGDAGFLPLLSTSSSLLQVASDALTEWLSGQLPELSAIEIDDSVDALVRLTVSHLVLPSGDSSETGRRISEVALRYLGLRAPSTRPGITK